MDRFECPVLKQICSILGSENVRWGVRAWDFAACIAFKRSGEPCPRPPIKPEDARLLWELMKQRPDSDISLDQLEQFIHASHCKGHQRNALYRFEKWKECKQSRLAEDELPFSDTLDAVSGIQDQTSTIRSSPTPSSQSSLISEHIHSTKNGRPFNYADLAIHDSMLHQRPRSRPSSSLCFNSNSSIEYFPDNSGSSMGQTHLLEDRFPVNDTYSAVNIVQDQISTTPLSAIPSYPRNLVIEDTHPFEKVFPIDGACFELNSIHDQISTNRPLSPLSVDRGSNSQHNIKDQRVTTGPMLSNFHRNTSSGVTHPTKTASSQIDPQGATEFEISKKTSRGSPISSNNMEFCGELILDEIYKRSNEDAAASYLMDSISDEYNHRYLETFCHQIIRDMDDIFDRQVTLVSGTENLEESIGSFSLRLYAELSDPSLQDALVFLHRERACVFFYIFT